MMGSRSAVIITTKRTIRSVLTRRAGSLSRARVRLRILANGTIQSICYASISSLALLYPASHVADAPNAWKNTGRWMEGCCVRSMRI